MDVLAAAVAAVALVLTGAVSGVFFAYSNSVVPGLGAVRPGPAIEAMNGMNRAIYNPRFLLTFTGPLVASPVAAVLLLVGDASGPALLLFGAFAVYVAGAAAPTAAVNVPMVNALAARPVPADEATAARVWSSFRTRWTRWNTVRTVSSLVSLLLIGLGLLVWGAGHL